MRCIVCQHRDSATIDEEIIHGRPLRSISAAFSLSLGTLHRHKSHVRQALTEAIQRTQGERAERGDDLLQRTQRLADEAIGILETAKASGNLKAATAAICACTRVLELTGRLDGSLTQPTMPGVHLHLSKTTVNVNYGDDKEFALLISEATKGFDLDEIQRLKALASCTDRAPSL
jgi:hypothetical protein